MDLDADNAYLGEMPKNPKCLFFLYRYLLVNIVFFENLANARRTLLWCQISFYFVAYHPLLLADSQQKGP